MERIHQSRNKLYDLFMAMQVLSIKAVGEMRCWLCICLSCREVASDSLNLVVST